MSVATVTKLSPEEYLAQERLAATKSEYLDGELRAMPGVKSTHSIICGNIRGELRTRLKGRQCFVFDADMRVAAPTPHSYLYPDVSLCAVIAKSKELNKMS